MVMIHGPGRRVEQACLTWALHVLGRWAADQREGVIQVHLDELFVFVVACNLGTIFQPVEVDHLDSALAQVEVERGGAGVLGRHIEALSPIEVLLSRAKPVVDSVLLHACFHLLWDRGGFNGVKVGIHYWLILWSFHIYLESRARDHARDEASWREVLVGACGGDRR